MIIMWISIINHSKNRWTLNLITLLPGLIHFFEQQLIYSTIYIKALATNNTVTEYLFTIILTKFRLVVMFNRM